MVSYGQRIVIARKRAHLTQIEAARKYASLTGITESAARVMLNRWEHDQVLPSITSVEPICRVLGCDIAWLITGGEAETARAKTPSAKDIDRMLGNAKRSMEMEGFVIDAKLEQQGRALLEGKVTIDELTSSYIREATQARDRHNRSIDDERSEHERVHGLSHMTFIVRDLDRATRFFEGVFDAEPIYASGERTFSLSKERFLSVGGLWICIMEGEPLAEQTYNHIAFQIDDADYDVYLRRIQDVGAPLRPERPRVAGEGRSIYVYDFDNHLFELHAGTLDERLQRYAADEA